MNTANTALNSFDMIVLGVLLLSSIIAFFRGFLRELLSFFAWVGAALFTLYYFPHAYDIMKDHVKDPKIAAGGGALATYVTALIVISIINSGILKYTKNATEVGLLDNFLGLIFGALRGLFVVSFGFIALQAVIPKSPPQQPDWYRTSVTKPLLKEGADALVTIAPEYLSDVDTVMKKQLEREMNPQNYPPVDTSKDARPGINPALR